MRDARSELLTAAGKRPEPWNQTTDGNFHQQEKKKNKERETCQQLAPTSGLFELQLLAICTKTPPREIKTCLQSVNTTAAGVKRSAGGRARQTCHLPCFQDRTGGTAVTQAGASVPPRRRQQLQETHRFTIGQEPSGKTFQKTSPGCARRSSVDEGCVVGCAPRRAQTVADI